MRRDSFFPNRTNCIYLISSTFLVYILHKRKCPRLRSPTPRFLTFVSLCDCHLEQDTGHCHHSRKSPCAPSQSCPHPRAPASLTAITPLLPLHTDANRGCSLEPGVFHLASSHLQFHPCHCVSLAALFTGELYFFVYPSPVSGRSNPFWSR